jgi:hypothetical protein
VFDFSLPGGDLIEAGLRDLTEGRETTEASLVSIGAPRLRWIGLAVPETFPTLEIRLYSDSLRPNRTRRIPDTARSSGGW